MQLITLLVISFIYLCTLRFSKEYLAFNSKRDVYLCLIALIWISVCGITWLNTIPAIMTVVCLVDVLLTALFCLESSRINLIYQCLSVCTTLMLMAITLCDPTIVAWRTAFSFLFILHVILRCSQVPQSKYLVNIASLPTPVSVIMHGGIINLPLLYMTKVLPFLDITFFVSMMTLCICLKALGNMIKLQQTLDYKSKLVFSTEIQTGFAVLTYLLISPTLAVFHVLTHALTKMFLLKDANNILQHQKYTRTSTPLVTLSLLSVGGIILYALLHHFAFKLDEGFELYLLMMLYAGLFAAVNTFTQRKTSQKHVLPIRSLDRQTV